MNSLQFLKTVWPTQGKYCIAIPFTPQGATKPTFSHRVFDKIEEAAAFCEKEKNRNHMFFCVHTLKKASVWNPKKRNAKTGEMGAPETRTQTNTLAAKAFFFDLDVGVSEQGKPPKYDTQRDALIGIKQFCKDAKLPKPMLVSSGGGVHVYWIMEEELLLDEWKPIAANLKKLAAHHGLKFDPMRTTDNSSVLRVAGTNNLKLDQARPVVVLTETTPLPVDDFRLILNDALIRARVAPAQLPAQPIAPTLGMLGQMPSHLMAAAAPVNVARYDGPSVDFKALARSCGQIANVAKQRGDVSEPEWYAALSSVRLVENASKWVHRISEGHPNYSFDETEAKVQQLIDKDIGPTTCSRWHEMNAAICNVCPFYGKVKAPLVAARKNPTQLAQPTAEYVVNGQVITTIIPKEPFGFKRSAEGLISQSVNKDGEEIAFTFFDHDLFPLRRLINKTEKTEDQVWRAMLPDPAAGPQAPKQAHDFVIPSSVLYDKKTLAEHLANNGIYPPIDNLQHMQKYMVAYISKLQKEVEAEQQYSHLGWSEDQTTFILPDKIILPDGSAKQVSLGRGAQRSSVHVTKKGTLQRQVELLEFYNHTAYAPQQFFLMCGLAAPLFYMTGHHGIVVNASGEPGASKSTALYTAASFWGQTKQYAINGTNNGATMRGRNERISTLANLPICVDEITLMKKEDAADMAMSVTQPGHRIRLDTNGIERAAVDSYKATIMMTTANNSLHSTLSLDNAAATAGSMRVFEIVMKKGAVHTKPQADDYMHELNENFGHIGEVFITHVVKNKADVEKRVREVMREIDLACNITSAERFWSALVASALVATEIASQLGLVPFSVGVIKRWVTEKQIPFSRGVVRDEYASPLSILANYLEHINENILIIQSTKQVASGNISLAAKMPRGALLARMDQEEGLLYVLKHDFKLFCSRIGANERTILHALNVPQMDANGKEIRVCVAPSARKVLGSGTDLEKAQAHVFIINMRHPDITGVVNLGVAASNPAVTPTPSTATLTVVKGDKQEEK